MLLTISQRSSEKGDRFIIIAQEVLNFALMISESLEKGGKSYNSVEQRIIFQSMFNHDSVEEIGSVMFEKPVMIGKLLVEI